MISSMATGAGTHPKQEGSRPAKSHVKLATSELISRIRKLEPKTPYLVDGLMGEISVKGTVPIPIYYHDHYRVMKDTEIALSRYGKLEKVPLKMRYYRPQTLYYVNKGDRPTDIFSYPYVYLKRRENQPDPVDEPRALWNETNSQKVSVKDLKNKLKAIPKTTVCENQHLKDIFYDGVKLAVYCSDSREKFTEARIALTEYEPMFVTNIVLNRTGSLCVIGPDGSTIYLGRDDFIYLPKI